MRKVQRQYVSERPKPMFRRGADGRLKPATEELEVADVWAEQKRVQLAEAVARAKAKAEKKRQRQGARRWLSSKTATPVQIGRATKAKEIEIKISMPKVSVAPVWGAVRRIRLPRFSAKQWAGVGAALVLVVFVLSTQGVYRKKDAAHSNSATGKSAVAGASTAPVGGTKPNFPTVLPAGKTIDKLGGWGRVSPPSSNPVFAYSDSLGSTHIVVSEQPLPDGFAGDLSNQLAKVAKQFDTTEKLTASDGSAIYLGTATTGAQSVVCSKRGLLILLRASAKISDQLWVDYIATLQ